METMAAASGEEEICRRNDGSWRCKNPSADNKLHYCETHYKDLEMQNGKKLSQDDEWRCSRTGKSGLWRCKDFRMNNATKFCEKHYNQNVNYYKKKKTKTKKKTCNGDGSDGRETRVEEDQDDDDDTSDEIVEGGESARLGTKRKYVERTERSGALKSQTKTREPVVETSATNRRKTVIEGDRFNDERSNQPATNADIQSGSANVGTKKKNVERTEESGELNITDFLTENPPLITSNKMMKKKEMKTNLPPDEQRCCIKDGGRWRCKNFRMGYGAASDDDTAPKTRYCEKHYSLRTKCRENFKKRSRDGEGIGTGQIEETRGSERRRKKVPGEDDETKIHNLGAISLDTAADTIIEDGTTANVGKNKKNVEIIEGSGEIDSLTKTTELYKSKCVELSVELEKSKSECTRLQGKLVEAETRKTSATDGTERTPMESTECWRKMFPDLECRLLRIENENSTMRCIESRISKLESLCMRMGDTNSTMAGCVESRISMLESLVLRMDNENSTMGSLESRISNLERLNVRMENENLTMGCLESRISTLESLVLRNVDDENGFGCLEERPSQHVSSSQAHMEMSTSEKADSAVDLKKKNIDPTDMLAMQNLNKDEMKWKSDADMISSFEKDPELCLKAVCALYRQEISEDKISPKGLLFEEDTLRCTSLAKFLMDEDSNGDLKKSVQDLETLDSNGVDDCKRLARRYSMHLFYIYQDRKDRFFRPATNVSQGD